MYCPKCRTEYREGFDTCADCNIPLVETLPPQEKKSFWDKPEKLTQYIKTYAIFITIFGAFSLLSIFSDYKRLANAFSNALSSPGMFFLCLFLFFSVILSRYLNFLSLYVGKKLFELEEIGRIWAIKRAYIASFLTIFISVGISLISFYKTSIEKSHFHNPKYLLITLIALFVLLFNYMVIKFFSHDNIVKLFMNEIHKERDTI